MKHLIFNMMLMVIAGILTGCVSGSLKTEKVRELTFVVLEEDEVPEELMGQIEKKKEKAFRMSYEDGGILYISEGYGRQQNAGCHVEAEEVYETENAVCLHTHLMGPEKEEESEKGEMFPYIVVAVEAIGKPVVFD
ncbi:MAG: protease complex subunit PrcB family protein [Schaedlerella sp.]|nr:protease complex subunit PrcB family protein [Schaedlerella sp.]